MPVNRPSRTSRARKKRYAIPILLRDDEHIDHSKLVTLQREIREHVSSDPSHTEFDLWIVSVGGNGKQAYLIASELRAHCCWLRVIVTTHAESAATLIVLAGDEIYMDDIASLGSLDVQWQRAEQSDLVCALDVVKSLDVLGAHATSYLLHTTAALKNSVELTADQLLSFAADLFDRVVDKSDPLWMGRVERELKLPVRYLVELLEARACQVPAGFSAEEVAKKFVYGFECHDEAIRRHHAAALGLPIKDLNTYPYIDQLREVYDKWFDQTDAAEPLIEVRRLDG